MVTGPWPSSEVQLSFWMLMMAAEDIDGLYSEAVKINLSRESFDVFSHSRGMKLLPPHHWLPQCVYCQRGWEWLRRKKNISLQSGLQYLCSAKSNSTMTPARLSCTLRKVSIECLTQALGFLMGLFSPRIYLTAPVSCLYICYLTGPIIRRFGRMMHGRVV